MKSDIYADLYALGTEISNLKCRVRKLEDKMIFLGETYLKEDNVIQAFEDTLFKCEKIAVSKDDLITLKRRFLKTVEYLERRDQGYEA